MVGPILAMPPRAVKLSLTPKGSPRIIRFTPQICQWRYSMALRDRLETDIRDAMRSRNQQRLSALRFLKNSLQMAELTQQKALFDKGTLKEGATFQMDDAGFVDVVTKQVKERRESIRMFQQGNRADLVAKESAELAVLEEYLPAQMGQEELRRLVQSVIKEVGATSLREKGKVMGKLMPQVRGKADGSQVNALVEELLGAGA
ncbi:MAG: GatB/YqeY domain-containing protein [SAR202 cluster bacterium]|nr:GatB/YqeY domain-containing protein [SAR202 cluster bacterium]